MPRGYSKKEIVEMGFPSAEYKFPDDPGEKICTLTMKQWGKQDVLICYFDTENGEKLKLCVWFSRNDIRSYRPRNSDLDISYVELGSRMRVVYDLTASGKSRFLDAELLEDRR